MNSDQRIYNDSKENEDMIHAPYESEASFFDYVKIGDVENVKKTQQTTPLPLRIEKGELGVLSLDPVRNMRYHVIISISMITRICIENGMESDAAYKLSDYYIRQADRTMDVWKLQALNEKMSIDFTTRMKNQQRDRVYSKNIVMALEYISTHLGEKITAQTLADLCNIHPGYLSRLFREEVGVGMSQYIQQLRVKTAKNMLEFTNDSLSDITNNLAFSSQSHFVKVFREQTGVTPKQYREYHFRESLESSPMHSESRANEKNKNINKNA